MSTYPPEFHRNPLHSMTLKQIIKQAAADLKEDFARKYKK